MKEQMIEALERIAKYPMTRSEEMSIETAREIARAALAAVPAQEPTNNLWRIERDYDMGRVYNSKGEFVAMTYGKYAQAFVDAHNATCVSQQPAPTMSQFASKADYLAAIAEPVKQESWISAKERLPSTKEMVISARKKRDGTWGLDLNYWTVSNQYAYEYTHWMPLPLPPVEVQP